jgi:hypothetical protein
LKEAAVENVEVTVRDRREIEIDDLDSVERNLWGEYLDKDLTAAQRLTALSEIRKVVHLRGLISGIVPVRPVEGGD